MESTVITDENFDSGAEKLFIPALAPLYALAAPLSYAFIRVTMGLMFLPSGIDKMFLGGNARIAAGNLTMLGLPNVVAWSWAVAATEFFGAILIILGLFTRFAAFSLVVLLTVITFGVQMKSGFLWSPRGFEVGLLMMLILIAVCFGGGGRFSLDRRIGREF
jgi:putative oxidoreductase